MPLTVYRSSSIDLLSEQLLLKLKEIRRKIDPMSEIDIVVPNRNIRKYLQLFIARNHVPALFLRFPYLEEGLQSFTQSVPIEENGSPLSRNELFILIRNILSESRRDADAAENQKSKCEDPFHIFYEYIGEHGTLYEGRLFQLANRLTSLFQSYIQHRNDMLAAWLSNKDYFLDMELHKEKAELYRAEKNLFLKLVQKAKNLNKRYYIPIGIGSSCSVHHKELFIFGFSQISKFHIHTLESIAKNNSIHYYSFSFSDFPSSGEDASINWNNPASENIKLFQEIIPSCSIQTLPAVEYPMTLLGKLQNEIATGKKLKTKTAPDESISIFRATGIFREVEACYSNIIRLLSDHPDLQTTDIAVLVCDMESYRSALLSVFKPAENHTLPANLTDFRFSSGSHFASGFASLIRILNGSFTRTDVYGILSNPLFLYKFKLSENQSSLMLDYIIKLGVYHGYEGDFGFLHALRRVRFALITEKDFLYEPKYEANDEWLLISPFMPEPGLDMEAVNVLCYAVEALYSFYEDWNQLQADSANVLIENIKIKLREFIDALFEIPKDASAEKIARQSVFTSLKFFQERSDFFENDADIKNFILSQTYEQLDDIPGSRGAYLSGGVSIAALLPMRQVPFKVIYILGLSEERFPGKDAESILDLRNFKKESGDISKVSANQYLFLETIMQAKEKIIFSYIYRDIEKDEERYASPLLYKLEKHINDVYIHSAEQNIVMNIPYHPFHKNYSANNKLIFYDENIYNTFKARYFKSGSLYTNPPAKTDTEIPSELMLVRLVKFLCEPAEETLYRHGVRRSRNAHDFSVIYEAPLLLDDYADEDMMLTFAMEYLSNGKKNADIKIDEIFETIIKNRTSTYGAFLTYQQERVEYMTDEMSKLLSAFDTKDIESVSVRADAIVTIKVATGEKKEIRLMDHNRSLLKQNNVLYLLTQIGDSGYPFTYRAMDAILFFMLLSISSSPLSSCEFNILMINSDAIKKASLSISKDVSLAYLSSLLQDYMNSFDLDYFPAKRVSAKLSKYFSTDSGQYIDYILEDVEDSITSERSALPDTLQLFDLHVPDKNKIADIIERRYRFIYESGGEIYKTKRSEESTP